MGVRQVDHGAEGYTPPANIPQGARAPEGVNNVNEPPAGNANPVDNGKPASNDTQAIPGNAEEGNKNNMKGGKKKRKGRKSRKTKGKKHTMKRKRSKGKTRRRR